MVWYGWMDALPHLDHGSEVPLYRQLYEQFAERIRSGELGQGERLPATRELAGSLGLNRTTVSAAYEMLEAEGMIAGRVGKGSFVTAALVRGELALAGRGPAPLQSAKPTASRGVPFTSGSSVSAPIDSWQPTQ